MPSPGFLILGGVAIAGLGIFTLCSPELIRRELYRSALGSQRFNRWLLTKFVSEDALVSIHRFTAGPALVIAGCLLLAKGLQGV